MKNLFYILVLILFFSCSTNQKKSQKMKCMVVAAEKMPIVSVMDEIDRKPKWKIKTDCAPMFFISERQFSVGDSVEVEHITFK